MAPRSAWKGYLKISLVAVPVNAYVGSNSEDGGVKFNQLHRDCHSRIRYIKTCPVHGEIPNNEIVSGYEYEKDHFVVIDPAELKNLRRKRNARSTLKRSFRPRRSIPSISRARPITCFPTGKRAKKPTS